MIEQTSGNQTHGVLEQVLRAELAQGDRIIATARPMLRHLLANSDHALFSDEVIARVRGMVTHVARQLLDALASVVVADGPEPVQHEAYVDEHEGDMAAPLLEDTAFLVHAHTLVLEAQLAERLHQRSGIDPALSPLLQELAASADAAQAATAMQVLAAQARFIQQQRRMEWPLAELPEDLFHKAMLMLQSHHLASAEVLATAQQNLRGERDESRHRIGQISRLIASLERKAVRALSLDHAGLSIFATALAMASDQDRELAIMSLGGNQYARLALSLKAAGLDNAEVEKQFLFLHPEVELPPGFGTMRADQAARMLAQTDVLDAD